LVRGTLWEYWLSAEELRKGLSVIRWPPRDVDAASWFGDGDMLASCRCVPKIGRAIWADTNNIALECPGRFLQLFSRSFPGVWVTTDDVPLARWAAPLFVPNDWLAVWGAFSYGTDPYLVADPARVAYYRRRIPLGSIGLCWGAARRLDGSPSHKSATLASLASIYSRFPCVSLQVGPERAEVAGTPVLDVLPGHAFDWAETAALLSACRAVVSVDTAVAHLAGALGVELHLLLLAPVPIYWALRPDGGGIDCPIYADATCYLRGGFVAGCDIGGWSDVASRIAAALTW
jgi:hypothetical protein